jgi:AraC-like DNA-binding protein
MGLHAGIPVTDKERIFEDTIKLAERMGFIAKSEIVVSTEVLQLFEGENIGEDLNRNQIHVLTPEEATFMTNFMELIEKEWQNPEVKVEDLEKNIGISKSRLYREMIRLTGKSPSVFLLHYRLRQSVKLLQNQKGNVSEVAYDSGFNSPSYYAKCFRKKYGIIPSAFVIQ